MAYINQLSTVEIRNALDDATYELVQTNQELENASELKSQFTARTSHELRTPLSAIIVFTDLALREAYGPLNERLQSGLTHVISSARHLKSIINDLLDLSKIEAGEMMIESAPFRLEEAIQTIAGVCSEIVEERQVQYSVWVSPEMPAYLVGDKSRITQVLVNLTTNAIKFTEEGEIEVRIEPDDSGYWSAMIRDTGPGIPEDQFEAIFQAYRQLDASSTSSKVKGTGLGLAITRNLIELMGGEIQVQSELGRGSTFTVRLPLIPAEVPEEEMIAAP